MLPLPFLWAFVTLLWSLSATNSRNESISGGTFCDIKQKGEFGERHELNGIKLSTWRWPWLWEKLEFNELSRNESAELN
jgi:hypothetical protein